MDCLSSAKTFLIQEKEKVEVSRQDDKGNKTVIAIRGEKEVIGEMALLGGDARCATVTALKDCDVSILEYEAFKGLPDSNPGVQALRKIMTASKKTETFQT